MNKIKGTIEKRSKFKKSSEPYSVLIAAFWENTFRESSSQLMSQQMGDNIWSKYKVNAGTRHGPMIGPSVTNENSQIFRSKFTLCVKKEP